MMDIIRLDDLGRREEHREDEEGDEETNLGGSDGNNNDIIDNRNWLSGIGREVIDINHMDPYKKYFGDEYNTGKNIGLFFEKVLLLEKECLNPRFIKNLMDHNGMTIKKTISVQNKGDYTIIYYGEPVRNNDDVLVKPYRRFSTKDGVIINPDNFNQLRSDIRFHYDNWKRAKLKKVMKKAGLAAGNWFVSYRSDNRFITGSETQWNGYGTLSKKKG